MANKLLFDNSGKPSMMVRIPRFKISDVIPGGSDAAPPAFIVDGVEVPEIFVSKYQNIIVDGKAYSLPFQEPAVNLNFDEARAACESKGSGWHLMTNAEWAAIALWAMKNGTLPRGNNNCGSDYRHADEKGIRFGGGYKVLTGSGPDTWAHDHTKDGIFDLNGNVWEWVSGLRLLGGEIQVIPDNNAARHIDQSRSSRAWQPVILDGKSLKYSETEYGMKLTTDDPEGDWNCCRFADIETDIDVPEILKALGLFPVAGAGLSDYFGADVDGERLPYRGGNWSSTSSAGVFALALSNPRSYSSTSFGFRSAFVNL